MRIRFGVIVAALVMSSSPARAYRVAAWIPSWDPTSTTSVQMHAGQLQESNPVWYSLDSGGNIVSNWNAENPALLSAITGTQVLPTIQNVVNGSFSGAAGETFVATAAVREVNAQRIADLVIQKAYDGVDIDFERLSLSARGNFSSFASLLAGKLHAAGKKLSVTVYARTSDSATWNGPGGQDYAALGAAADFIKIMGYDYHWDGSDAGVIAPLEWLDRVATYAESRIDSAKVMMGLPWYGYDWQGTAARGLVYSSAMELALANHAVVAHDLDGEATFTYGSHEVHFQDATSFFRKLEILKRNHPSLGGFSIWRTGNEDPDMWHVLDGSFPAANSGGSGGSAAKGDFIVNGPLELEVKAGQRVSADYSIVRINDLAAAVTVAIDAVGPLAGDFTLSNASLTLSASSTTITFVAPAILPAGTYQARLRMTSGSIVHEQQVTIAVSAAPKVHGRGARK